MKQSTGSVLTESDQEAILELINQWTYYRDNYKWDQLKETFHSEGKISTIWFEGPYSEFIKSVSRQSRKDDMVRHVMGVPHIKINKHRAICETDVIISARGNSGPLKFDLTSYVRFYDLLEKRDDAWRFINRTVIYERDRIDSVNPSLLFWIAGYFIKRQKLPEAYRYLGYGLKKRGTKLMENVVTSNSMQALSLMDSGEKWIRAV